MFAFLLASVPAFGVACLLTYLLTRPGSRFQILDHPNERSLHVTPTPRTGGLAIWAGWVVGMTAVLGWLGVRAEIAWIIGAVLLVGVVSFIDDRSHVPVGIRLAIHFLASAVAVGGLGLQSSWLLGIELNIPTGVLFLLVILFLVWMTNLYNFMDGMDGFAAGMAVVGFGVYALMGGLVGNSFFLWVNAVIAASAAGFLVFNFPPARIFMGDMGSSTLGFLAGVTTLWASKEGIFPLWTGVLVFSPFIVDATITLITRTTQRERLWEAHRTHYYQRLVQLGWGHRRTVLWEYALMLGCGASALWAIRIAAEAQWAIIGFWIGIYALLAVGVRHLENERKKLAK